MNTNRKTIVIKKSNKGRPSKASFKKKGLIKNIIKAPSTVISNTIHSLYDIFIYNESGLFLSAWDNDSVKVAKNKLAWEVFTVVSYQKNLFIKTWKNKFFGIKRESNTIPEQVNTIQEALSIKITNKKEIIFMEQGGEKKQLFLYLNNTNTPKLTNEKLNMFKVEEKLNTHISYPSTSNQKNEIDVKGGIYFDLGSQLHGNYGNHRSGWKYAISAFENIPVSQNAVLLDSFLEKTFLWEKYRNIVYNRHWVGFIHNPPNIPEELIYNDQTPQTLLRSENFKKSLKFCQGIFVLSNYLKTYLSLQPLFKDVPINVVYHPTENVIEKFTMEKFNTNTKKRVIQLGYWLRRKYSIFQLDKPNNLCKAILPFDDRMQENLKHELEVDHVTLSTNEINSVECLSQFKEDEYDKILSKNVVFLDLYDSSANNAIIECIIRHTPVLVNRLPAVEEYLGVDYPFYYSSLKEATSKLENCCLIEETFNYLKSSPLIEKLSKETFYQSIMKSEIYQTVEKKYSTEGIHFVSLHHSQTYNPNSNSTWTIDQHCGDVMRELEKEINMKLFYRNGDSSWWKTIPSINNSKNTFTYVGFFEHFLSCYKQNSEFQTLVKSFTKIFYWFDDLDTWKLNNTWKSDVEIIQSMNLTILHPVQQEALKLSQAGYNAFYINWSAKRFENVNVFEKEKDVLRIFLDYDSRYEENVIIHCVDIFERIANISKQYRQKIEVHIPINILDNLMDSISINQPLIKVTVGRKSYTELMSYFKSSHIYITNIRGSYEFCVLESQLHGNYVIQVGDPFISEHKIIDNTFQCDNLEKVEKVIVDNILPQIGCEDNIKRITSAAKEHYSWQKAKDGLKKTILPNF